MNETHPFVESLYALAKRQDRAALAELRRSITAPMAAMRYVVPFLRKDASEREHRALLLVGQLFALHPAPGNRSLAGAMRMLSEQSDSVQLRFRALLDSDGEDLPVHLRHAISLARGKEIAIDYDNLLVTILNWDKANKRAQRAWAHDFWGQSSHDSQ